MTSTVEVSLFDQKIEEQEAPKFSAFRQAVDHVQSPRDANLIKLLYLGAFRVSEISTKISPYEETHQMTRAYGKAFRWHLTDFTSKNDTFLMESAIAKRTRQKDGQEHLTFKQIALPVDPNFEPWSRDLLKCAIQQADLSIKLGTKQLLDKGIKDPQLHRKMKRELMERSLRVRLGRAGIEYILRQNLGSLLPRKDKHNNRNPLRHWRLSHLAEVYDFDGYDLTQIAGWSYGSSMAGQGASGMLDHYLHLSWKKYYQKLCVPLADVM